MSGVKHICWLPMRLLPMLSSPSLVLLRLAACCLPLYQVRG